MPYTPIVSTLASQYQPVAGNKISYIWGDAVKNDIVAIAANYIHKDGSVGFTGPPAPASDLFTGLGTALLRFGSAHVNILELSTRIGMGGAEVLTANKELVRIAGLSTDGTPRKLVMDLSSHKYIQFLSYTWSSLASGGTGVDLAMTFPSNPAGVGSLKGQFVNVNLGANTGINPTLIAWHANQRADGSVTVRFYQNTGSTMNGVLIDGMQVNF